MVQFLYESGLIDKDKKIIDLEGADLGEAVLYQADLPGAKVTDEQLATAETLKGATMPDGTKHA